MSVIRKTSISNSVIIYVELFKRQFKAQLFLPYEYGAISFNNKSRKHHVQTVFVCIIRFSE
jgi:hypothetical protein